MFAAKESDEKRYRELLKDGANPKEETPHGLTLVHFAAVNKEHGMDIVAYFKTRDIGKKDEDGEEPIHYAVRRGNYDLANRFLRLMKSDAENMLHFSVTKNDLNYAKLVHEMDPSLIETSDSHRKSALRTALTNSANSDGSNPGFGD
ncbi:Hypothetical predicted protein [Cloeon dipterum]|uniref:Uncharacterized protein n=1 Tax=Cloeon dipterum TaxID=197152 RepID=A0A8S1DW77_9INSE|nr:Hypothetical predicted protein [Cloeon dipterum]